MTPTHHQLAAALRHLHDAGDFASHTAAQREAAALLHAYDATPVPTVVVYITGGNWAGCHADAPVRVIVADYDTDGDEESVTDPEGDTCHVWSEEPYVNAELVAAFKGLANV